MIFSAEKDLKEYYNAKDVANYYGISTAGVDYNLNPKNIEELLKIIKQAFDL